MKEELGETEFFRRRHHNPVETTETAEKRKESKGHPIGKRKKKWRELIAGVERKNENFWKYVPSFDYV